MYWNQNTEFGVNQAHLGPDLTSLLTIQIWDNDQPDTQTDNKQIY